MNQGVTVEQKKEFVRWFLKRYQMKRRECKWILTYLLSHDNLMERVHFVEESHYCPRAMVMSVTESSGVPFRFYKGNLMTADAEKSFHDLRLNPTEDMYIQLNFPNVPPPIEYLSALEQNTFMPKYLNVNDKDTKLVNELIEHLMNQQEDEAYNRMIDEALDTGNKERFLALTQKLVTS